MQLTHGRSPDFLGRWSMKTRDKSRAKATKAMLLWLVGAAQPIAEQMNYVPLPANIVRYSKAQLERMHA